MSRFGCLALGVTKEKGSELERGKGSVNEGTLRKEKENDMFS